MRDRFAILKQTAKEWNDDDPWRHGAIIAYYAIFSMPGLLTIVIWAAGIWFGEEAIRGQVSDYFESLLGDDAAGNIESIIVSAELASNSGWMKLLGIGALIFGATTLFLQIQKSLNDVWSVEGAPESGLFKLLLDRITSLGLILTVAFLLLITLVISAVLAVLSMWIEKYFGEVFLVIVHSLNAMVSMAITTALFATMYKMLPDVEIPWRPVWVGAIATAFLFTFGKTLLGLYFGIANPASSFGAASSIILLMLWVNYTCLILFFGAKLSKVYAEHMKIDIRLSAHAKWVIKR